MCGARGLPVTRIGVVDGDTVELQGEFELSLEELRRAEHVAFAWPVRALFPEHDDPLRIAERQPFEQHRVDDREDRGVGADAERERQDSDSREARRPQVQTDGVADVVEEGVH